MAYPTFIGSVVDTNKYTFNNIREEFLKYEYFVSLLLYACDGILDVYARRPDWARAVKEEIGWHQTYLSSSYFVNQYLLTASLRVQRLIIELKTQHEESSGKIS
jgi:hypothetical protein